MLYKFFPLFCFRETNQKSETNRFMSTYTKQPFRLKGEIHAKNENVTPGVSSKNISV